VVTVRRKIAFNQSLKANNNHPLDLLESVLVEKKAVVVNLIVTVEQVSSK
jgi:hypothetical protein